MSRLNIDLKGLSHLGRLSGGYFVTTIINQSLPLLILPILTRYLPPEEYGNIALFTFYLVLSNSVSGISVITVISKHFFNEDKETIARIIGNSIFIVACLSLITILLIILIYPFIDPYTQLPLLWLVLIPLTSLTFIIFSIGLNVIRNSKKVLTFGKHQIGNTFSNLLISIVLIVLLLGGWRGRVWGIVLSNLISGIVMYHYLHKNGFISFKITKESIKTILKVLIPLIPNSIQVVIISQVGVFFIQLYFSKGLLGLYSIGFQIAVMVKLLTDTLNMSWSPYLYEQITGSKVIDKLYLTRLCLVLIGVLIIGLLFINFSAGIVLELMTTPAYYGARVFIPWFTLGYLFYGIYILLFPILIKNNKQKFISSLTFLNMLIMIAMNILFVKLFGFMGIAYAFTITYFLMFLALFWKAQRVFPLPWLSALKVWN
jgi:O-antigen/teichoic acid export membrane protein